jgi:hypothetical protein
VDSKPEVNYKTDEQYADMMQKGKKRVTILGIVLTIIGVLLLVIIILPNNFTHSLVASNQQIFNYGMVGFLFLGVFLLVGTRIATQPPIPTKTIKNFTITGYPKSHIKDAIHNWIIEEKITLDEEKDDFIKGHFGWGSIGTWEEFKGVKTFFEVYIFARQNEEGFDVNTYGWVKQQGRRPYLGHVTALSRTPHYIEMELGGNEKRLGGERKKGLEVINNLWTKLETMTNKV